MPKRTVAEYFAAQENALRVAMAVSRADHALRTSKSDTEWRAEVQRALAASVRI
jgi:hypothetical protein